MNIELTKQGKRNIELFILECKAKQKEILDAGIDTADDTIIPTIEDILSDMEYDGIDRNGDYYNCWGVGDNTDSSPIYLAIGKDFIPYISPDKWGVRVGWDYRPSELVKIQRADEISEENSWKTYLVSVLKDKSNRDFLKTCKPINQEWKNLLRESKWSVYYKNKMYLKNKYPDTFYLLQKILLGFAGEDTCLNMGSEGLKDCKRLIADGQFWLGKSAKMMKGEVGHCHSNSAKLYSINKDNFDVRICTGYALSDDGMWREHSWLIRHYPRSNEIIETTKKRICYFGWVLTPEECERAIEEWIW